MYLLYIITAVQNEPEQLRPFHLVEHGRVVVIGVVLVWTPLVVGFGTDLPVVVDDDLPVADLALPAADLLLSATAPLSQQLAAAAESAFQAPLYEIYGCTETGQLATRRTTQGQVWRTLGEVRLRCEDAAVWAEGGHVETLTRLNDEVELVAFT